MDQVECATPIDAGPADDVPPRRHSMSPASRKPSVTTRAVVLASMAVAAILLVPTVAALWPSDPATNLCIADRAGGETDPIPVPTSDGGCYVGWFDPTSGNYDAYLQRIDPAGNEQWPHGGILISNHPQNSALFGWDLTVDAEDNAIMVFSDMRAGANLDVIVYKISPDGDLLWGADGIALSAASGDEMSPTVTVADDGDAVVTWSWFPLSGDGAIYMQRISPTGVLRYAAGGLRIAGDPGESPAFSCPVASLGGSVIVSWVRDISSYSSPRHLYAQRFAPDGSAVWPVVVHIYDQVALPMGFRPTITSDSVGGVLSTWNAAETSLHTVRVQHLNALGNELFGHNGARVTLDATRNHIAPTLTYHPDTGECFVFWDERNSQQSTWGLYGQRLSTIGTRLWGDQGHTFIPLNTVYKTMFRSTPCADGAIVLWFEETAGPYLGNVVRAMRADASGATVWPQPIETIASTLSDKRRLPVIATPDEMVIAIWEDSRSGELDIYGQNVNPDGTLGVDPAAVTGDERGGGPVGSLLSAIRLSNAPSPFSQQTVIQLVTPVELADADLLISDAGGRVVCRLPLGSVNAGESQVTWDGRDGSGRRMATGLYFYSLMHSRGVSAHGETVLLR
jgi:hypothetical protein